MRTAVVLAAILGLFCLQGTLEAATTGESGETEKLRFAYDGHTEDMVATDAVYQCYRAYTIKNQMAYSKIAKASPEFLCIQHMLMVVRQAVCYIFVLTDAERAQVHTDAGLRSLELQQFDRLRDPSLVLTTVPKQSLHTNILKECGHGILTYHIVQ